MAHSLCVHRIGVCGGKASQFDSFSFGIGPIIKCIWFAAAGHEVFGAGSSFFFFGGGGGGG